MRRRFQLYSFLFSQICSVARVHHTSQVHSSVELLVSGWNLNMRRCCDLQSHTVTSKFLELGQRDRWLKGRHTDPDIRHDNLISLFSFLYKEQQGKDNIVGGRKKEDRNSILHTSGRIFDIRNTEKNVFLTIVSVHAFDIGCNQGFLTFHAYSVNRYDTRKLVNTR